MANQARLAGNVALSCDGPTGAPRRGWALLQGIVVCGRCGRRMGLRYSGPHGDYPSTTATPTRPDGSPRCQEVRALPVDAMVSACCWRRWRPSEIALAVAAVGQLEAEAKAAGTAMGAQARAGPLRGRAGAAAV